MSDSKHLRYKLGEILKSVRRESEENECSKPFLPYVSLELSDYRIRNLDGMLACFEGEHEICIDRSHLKQADKFTLGKTVKHEEAHRAASLIKALSVNQPRIESTEHNEIWAYVNKAFGGEAPSIYYLCKCGREANLIYQSFCGHVEKCQSKKCGLPVTLEGINILNLYSEDLEDTEKEAFDAFTSKVIETSKATNKPLLLVNPGGELRLLAGKNLYSFEVGFFKPSQMGYGTYISYSPAYRQKAI